VADDDDRAEHGVLLEAAERSQRLGDPDEGRDTKDDLGEARRCSRPAGQQQRAHPVGAERERGEHGRELDDPDQVVAGGKDALARRRGEERRCRAHAPRPGERGTRRPLSAAGS
jgi:hypothetical protein